MNFLELCQRTLLESGTESGRKLKNFDSLTTFQEQVRGWVREAWIHIQQSREDWGWRTELPFTMAAVAKRNRYRPQTLLTPEGTPSILAFRDWVTANRWFITDERISLIAGYLPLISYQEWRRRSRATPHPARPTAYAIGPDQTLYLHPTPETPVKIEGEYQLGVQLLENERDMPVGLDPDYHEIIKWRAIMAVHGFDEDDQSYVWAASNYQPLRDTLERLHLPDVQIGGALA